MVLGVWVGSANRSASVRMASPLGLRRWKGLKSNFTHGSSPIETTVASTKAPSTTLRRSCMKRSSGARAGVPTSTSRIRGRASVRSAGRSVRLKTSPTTMPIEAMIPSSDTPT